MSRVARIATLENAKGEITHVTIDVKKHREIMTPILYQLGIIEESKFMKDFENGLTIEEARKSSHEFIKELWMYIPGSRKRLLKNLRNTKISYN